MTHYYLYIESGLQIDHRTRFYKVGVGESAQQVKRRAWLEAYAFEHGHFFVRWSADAAEFVIKCQQSIGVNHPEMLAVYSDDLYRYFSSGGEEPAFYQSALNRHHLLMQIDPEYYCYSHLQAHG